MTEPTPDPKAKVVGIMADLERSVAQAKADRHQPEPTPVPDAAEVNAIDLIYAVLDGSVGPDPIGNKAWLLRQTILSRLHEHGGPNGVTIRPDGTLVPASPDASLTPAPGEGLSEAERERIADIKSWRIDLCNGESCVDCNFLLDLLDRLTASPAPPDDPDHPMRAADRMDSMRQATTNARLSIPPASPAPLLRAEDLPHPLTTEPGDLRDGLQRSSPGSHEPQRLHPLRLGLTQRRGRIGPPLLGPLPRFPPVR